MDKVNGRDLDAVFGTLINNGRIQLFNWAKRKDSVTVDMPDFNGKLVDLADPKFEARQITFHCTTRGKDQADFKQKIFGLKTELQKPGSQEFTFTNPDFTVYLYLIEMRNPRLLSTGFENGKVGMDYDLVFGEIDPALNLPDVYIVTEEDVFLIA